MREVKSEFGWGDKGSFLIDMIAKNLSQSEIEDVCSSVVVTKGPSTKLEKPKFCK